ncbi:hypothetical protein [Vampirovibrio sp.]|uniref:hypothetical protein n=1 Tax=Vampirovibrio sp. TaxID=2717857 RepID=UPI0035930683
MAQPAPTTPKGSIRTRCKGGILVLFCGLAVLIIGFMGLCIYTGLQAFVEGDLQRVSMNAAMVGAAGYYSNVGTFGKPLPSASSAKNDARNIFQGVMRRSSVGGFGARVIRITSNDSNDSVSVTSRATLPTALLTPIGIQNIQVNATATARAVKYEPTAFTGPIEILPDGVTLASYSRTLDLAFPLVNGLGTDLYVEQPAEAQQGYVVEACNSRNCYDLIQAATPVGSGQILTSRAGKKLIYGSATFNLGRIKVHKATKLRFTHGNDFKSGYFKAGAPTPYDSTPLPLTIQRVMIFHHASACVSPSNCPVPAGFSPVE